MVVLTRSISFCLSAARISEQAVHSRLWLDAGLRPQGKAPQLPFELEEILHLLVPIGRVFNANILMAATTSSNARLCHRNTARDS